MISQPMPNVLIINQQTDHRIPQKFLRDSLAEIFKHLGKKKIMTAAQKKLDVNLVFLDPAGIQSLNTNFRKKAKPTDILSFASEDPELLGELVLCPEIILGNAALNQWPKRYEYLYMLIHGVLHLLGYDHENDSDAKKMFTLQNGVFNALSDGPQVNET